MFLGESCLGLLPVIYRRSSSDSGHLHVKLDRLVIWAFRVVINILVCYRNAVMTVVTDVQNDLS